jgi:hypothetical protein
MKLVIDRSRWLRGKTGGYLLDKGRMCCLGFHALAVRYADPEDIDGLIMPSSLRNFDVMPSGWLFARALCGEVQVDGTTMSGNGEGVLAGINDAEQVDDETREPWIRAGFIALSGGEITEVEFTDGPVPQ